MQRIHTLLQKLTELSEKDKDYALIDVDLMLDYTRVVYADLIELRANVALQHLSAPTQAQHAVATGATTTESVITVITQPAEQEPAKAAQPEPVAEQNYYEPHQPGIPVELNINTPAPVEEPVSIQESVAEKLHAIVEKTIKEPAPQPLQSSAYAVDVRMNIGINDKYLFINELFKDDRTAYDNAIKKLNTFSSLADATKWVDEELRDRHGWDEDEFTVQSFYSLLSNSFRSK